MIKDIMAKNKDVLPNSYEIEKLKQVFPQYFDKEGNFDFDNFKQNLENNGVSFSNESFGLNFLGKQYARLQAGLDTETVITPDLEHNNKPENKNSENIYIKGDNIDALRHLLKSYAGKIKCIYIDPPYNTGSDGFAYPDKFEYSKEDFERMGLSDEEAERILSLKGKSSHSAWLSFMYPRLILARDLLSDDGVIFMSIDYNENYNLRNMAELVFGDIFFVGEIYWESKTKSQNTSTSYDKLQPKAEMILVYAKKEKYRFNLIRKGEKEYPLIDEKGKYREYPLEVMNANGVRGRESMVFGVTDGISTVYPPKNKQWKLGQVQVAEYQNSGNLFIRDNKVIIKMRPEFERNETTEPFWGFLSKEIGTAESAKKELTNIIGNNGFETVKPVELVKRLFYHVSKKNDYVFDFFSGSATSAHACLQLNAEDGGNRKFIMVQIPEKLKEDNEGYKAGFRTICDIGIERIKRASQKIKEETNADIDYGFKIYELNEVSEDTIDKCDSFDKASNLFIPENYIDYFKFGNVDGIETILQTWKVRDGFGFTAEHAMVDINGYNAYKIGKNLYLINSNIKPYIKQLLEYLDKTDINLVVLFGYSFNLEELQELKVNIKNTFDKNSGKEIVVEDRY